MTEIAVVDDREVWEKRRGESNPAFAAFALYRDLGPERSLRKAAEETGKSLSQMQTWSSKFSWVERADEYDLYIDRRLREVRESELTRIERETESAGLAILGRGLTRLRGGTIRDADGQEVVVSALDLNEMTAGDTLAMIEKGTKLRRLGAGLPTDFLKGAMTIRPEQWLSMARDLIEAALEEIEPERHSRYLAKVDAIAEGRRA